MRWTRLFTLLSLCILAVSPVFSADKIKVLVVTGGHDFEQQPFFGLFENNPDVEFTSRVHPKANEAFTDGTAKQFDVIVLYDMWQDITPEQQKGFLEYLDSGKGLIALHHNLGSYQAWPEYADLIGGAYILDAKGRTIGGKEYKASNYLHDVDMKVQIADPNHPITKGLKDFEIHDETYKDLYVSPKAHVLLKSDHPTSNPVVGWVMPHPKARIATLQLGHDSKSYSNPNFSTLLSQAIAWAAGK